MPDILFIKTSSLGDVVHHMPAVTDVRRHRPDARISWVVEEPYAPLAALHPAVDRVIPVASRRWRHRLLHGATWREMRAFRAELRAQAYDLVIDTQGLLRSGIIARLAVGPRHGYDKDSIREPIAAAFYDVRHRVGRTLHAVARNRILTGLALGYTPEGPPDFGLSELRQPPARAAVLLHGTARPEKQWPVAHWRAVATALAGNGYALVLPSGSDAELARSRDIAAGLPGMQMPHRQPLDAVARTLAGAAVVIGVDTGLLHLAAALTAPVVAIFVGGSDPRLTRPVGSGAIQVLGSAGTPAAAEVLTAAERIAATAP